MSSVVVPIRHYAAGGAPDRSYYQSPCTKGELSLATADLLPEQEDHERSDTVAALERMLERLCGIEVP